MLIDPSPIRRFLSYAPCEVAGRRLGPGGASARRRRSN